MKNKKFILSLVILTYIFSNIFIFILLDNSKYNKTYFICEKNVVLKQNFTHPSIDNIIRTILREITQIANVHTDTNTNAITIQANDNGICEQRLDIIKKITNKKVDNFILTIERKKRIADKNIYLPLEGSFLTELAIVELNKKQNIEIIGLEVLNINSKTIDNSTYTIVIYVIFNFFITLLIITTYVYYKNNKLFGLKLKRK